MGTATARNYSLTGPESARASERGLASAAWFQPVIDPATMRRLQTRTNGRAARDTVLWLVLIAISGVTAFVLLGSWWAIPAFIVFGALVGGASDARWHESGHGTAFKTPWVNDVVYYMACFMDWRAPTYWRWSHYRHHTDTIIVGRDAEILFERPSNVWRAMWAFFHIEGGLRSFWLLIQHAVGVIGDDARDFIPEHELGKVKWEARIFVGIVLGAAAWSIAIGSIVPSLFIGLPAIYGGWLMVFFGITQHAAMQEDVLDHRLNTRSVLMNPMLRFLYLNMNYHVEHHVFPSVPYHALPELHREIGDQLAPPKPNVAAAYREIFSTLWKQQHDPSYELAIDLPPARGGTAAIDVAPHLWQHGDDGSIQLGSVDDLAAGELRRFDIGERTFVIAKLDDGQVVLADGLCTHQAVHLCDGAIVDGTIECPKHNGRFDACSGDAVRRPPRVALTVYDVDVSDGNITTHLIVRSAMPTDDTSRIQQRRAHRA